MGPSGKAGPVRIVAIAGGSCSGKTTLARRIAEALGPSRAAILSQDSYYIDQSARFDVDGGAVNFDHPDAIDFTLLAAHLSELSAGREVEVPVYDFPTHRRLARTERFEPRELILVDGILILARAELRPQFAESVFIEVSEEIRLRRRLERDVRERGRDPEGVRRQFFSQVKPMHDLYVEPSRRFATRLLPDEAAFEEFIRALVPGRS